MQRGNAEEAAMIRSAIENGDTSKLSQIVQIVQSSGALEASQAAAHQEAERAMQALSPLPQNAFTQALWQLASQLLERRA